ncbi:GIY-YIG nuclease family protein [Pelagerythrobacter aerophilus]|uniref:GIY-YIG nuclease family protein n=1 Tax=Pelagerythrobacter aerophilus TaxID=2306995 RepID=A0A418NIF9_9SPHN|nr:GIY-YIG nuclease family protein [Pelagerythrobacter aerophilus]RIV78770.1 GIY-YIG nuclease family protein [Pelagerythrobacter aerophilus]
MAELSDLELLAELGVDTAPEPVRTLTPLQERIIAGFEDIQRFVKENGRLPQHGEDRDIFERLYAVRLERLRALPEARELLANLDSEGILDAAEPVGRVSSELDDSALLAELGIEQDADDDITKLRHVSSRAEKRAAEEIANREKCEDFEEFRPLFEGIEADLKGGLRQTKPLGNSEVTLAEIQPGNFFIVGGQLAYVAASTDAFTTQYERADRRVRIIYDNATEATVLSRSFQKSLYRDESARRVSEQSAGPLFGDTAEPDDLESGTIYVLRSKSSHPYIDEHRELIHKIGVTGQPVASRIANARNDPTFLLADVEIVDQYRLYNINRTKLERLIHRALGPARLDLSAGDRFGKTVQPREWFFAPLSIISELISRISDGTITQYVYDPVRAEFVAQDDA